MTQVLLAYAHADGQEPAHRLAELLRALGVAVVEADEPGSLHSVAGVIAVLTPAALSDRRVLALLQGAPAQGRPLLPLSTTTPADFPTPGDLARILEWRAASPAAPAQGAKYYVVNAVNSSIGDGAVTVNVVGQAAGWSAAETAQLVAALRSRPAGEAMSAQELRDLFAGLQAQVQQVDHNLATGFRLTLARFDVTEQRILSPILARLDDQEATLLDKILDVLDVATFGADELDRHLTAIDAALAEVNAISATIADRQLVASAQQVAELASPLGLDVKHKLKLTIPIIPVLLSYEGAFELGSKLDLAEVWRALQDLLRS
jgi:hypothetical protein